MINAMKKNGGLLAIFALLATTLVSVTNLLTEDRIQEQQQKELLKVLNQVIPADSHDNELYKSCTLINNEQYLGTPTPMPAYVAEKAGQKTGIAIEAVAPDGYSGAIKLVVGLNIDGKVTGVRVLNHNETPGLGDKIDTRISNWINSFTGKKVNGEKDTRWAVRKDGGEFDQFTGATITPRAVVGAVKRVSLYYQQNQQHIFDQPLNCG
ncbi:electron transport complex subunit RsxG [Photobacterium ganghwense]|uniref:Ion-translocating oxidoreductase complex subunit G n=1 Tax=Photobacterium ganghwense TaxID=320778 RepID=A0A0J1HGL5_9GAMM|nr:electron transport complex subunit RsxG [Photobacterium ganghwense]KLV10745.1 electron transporter RnfG [Photobacterium ganghwense]PSU11083.1 electron transport complex subunit RsxG [Photobacterium ganghwense]QSV13188.1 electron transport complex subunit RsxG [Photobacterium ganghwense]